MCVCVCVCVCKIIYISVDGVVVDRVKPKNDSEEAGERQTVDIELKEYSQGKLTDGAEDHQRPLCQKHTSAPCTRNSLIV